MDNKYALGPPVVFFLQYTVDDVVDVVAEDCIAEIRRDGVGLDKGYPGVAERIRPVTGRRDEEVVRTKAGFRNSQRARGLICRICRHPMERCVSSRGVG